MDEALDFAAHRAGFRGPLFTEQRKLIFLEIFRLKEKRSRLLRHLSQGEQKKALMALDLLSVKGNVFVADPLTNLEESSRRRFVALLLLLSVKKDRNYQINVFPRLTLNNEEEAHAPLNENELRRLNSL